MAEGCPIVAIDNGWADIDVLLLTVQYGGAEIDLSILNGSADVAHGR